MEISKPFFVITWTNVAASILVSDRCLAESWRTHLGVAQDSSLPAGAASALVQVPGLSFHIKLPSRCSTDHDVHSFWLTTAWLVYNKPEKEY